ncbi:MAG: glycosyltransferase family 2 protein [Acidobacteriota bacterium]
MEARLRRGGQLQRRRHRPRERRAPAAPGPPGLPVVVVDNGSTDGSTEALQRFRSPRLSLVYNGQNLGCGAARNVGIRHASGEVIAFVDDDAFAEKSWLLRGSTRLAEREDVGVVASKSIFDGDRAILNSLGGRLNLQGYGMDMGFGEPLAFWDSGETSQKPLYATGNGLITRREVLATVGGFDPLFFNYYDDVDFSIRAWKAGYQVDVAPDAVLYHVLSHSDRNVGRKALLCERNRIRNVLKHYDLPFLARWLPREVSYELSADRPVARSLFARAWLWNLGHLPSLLGYRLRGKRRHLGSHPALVSTWGALGGKYHNLKPRRVSTASCSRVLAGTDDGALRYGFYMPEECFGERFRWTDDLAAISIELPESATRMRIRFMFAPGVQGCDVHVIDVRGGRGVSGRLLRHGRWGFSEESAPMKLPPSTYEILLQPDSCYHEPRGARRRLGLGLAMVAFEP